MNEIILSSFADEASPDVDRQIAAMKRNGIRYIEPRTVDGVNVSDLTDAQVHEFKNKLDAYGYKVSAIGSPIGKIDILDDFGPHFEKFKRTVRIAEMLGTDRIRMFSFYIKNGDYEGAREQVLQRMQAMCDYASQYGVKCCHENEKGIYGDTCERVIDLLDNVKGLCSVFDPANYIQCGELPSENIKRLAGRTEYLHIKDAIMSDGSVVPAGHGDGEISFIMNCMTEIKKPVIMSIEPHLMGFVGLSDLQSEELLHKFSYESNDAAYDAAIGAVKNIIKAGGHEYMEQVRVGVIGIGNMGTAHCSNISQGKVDEMKLTAACDIKQDRLDWVKENCPGVETFTDYKQMLASGLVDAVIIAVPHYLHPPMAIDAFGAGLHVLTEKPAGVYTKQVREMNEVAEKSGKVFGIMYNQRTNPFFAKMREVVQSGQLGELKRSVWIITNWYRSQRYYDSGTWRATWDGEGGGALVNQCPHNLDLWQWIFGMPCRIRAKCHYGKWHDIEVEDDVTIYAEYENGATGVFITSTADLPGTNRFEITGDKGKMVFESGKLTWWKLSEPERKVCFETEDSFYHDRNIEVIDVVPDGTETAHVGILRNFGSAILNGTELLAPGYDGIKGLTISNATHLSDWTDTWVDLPIDEDKFLELLNERRATSKAKEHVESVVSDLSGTYNDRWQVR